MAIFARLSVKNSKKFEKLSFYGGLEHEKRERSKSDAVNPGTDNSLNGSIG